MTIKQYGSLTLDLNTVKETYDSFGANLLIRLHDGNQITLQKKWHVQFTKDYQEFTLLKVIKEAFDSVFDNKFEIKKDSKIYELSSTKFWCKIWDNGEFAFAKDSSITGELPRFYAAHCLSDWIRYAQQIKDKYLDSIVDPVKVAEQLIKSSGLNLWVLRNNDPKYYFHLVNTNVHPNETITFKCSCLMFATAETKEWKLCREHDNLNTKSDWKEFITEALDRYYDSQQPPQPTEVDLKLMLGKALKDNGLVAKEIAIYNKNLIAIVYLNPSGWLTWSINKNLINCEYCINANNRDTLKYSLPNSLEDWQTIFSDSLAQYKKLTKADIVKCLESSLEGLSVESISDTLDDSLVGTIELKLIDYKKIIWELTKDRVNLYNFNKERVDNWKLPKNKLGWYQLFNRSLLKKSKITILDLIKQAFPNYKFYYKAHISESGNFICYGFHNSITLEVAYNPKLNLIELFTVKERGESGEYYFSKSRDFFTKENLTNYTNWEQWLEELIKVNQNLKDLEQSPNLVVKAMKQLPQRVNNLPTSTRPTLTELEDPWECD